MFCKISKIDNSRNMNELSSAITSISDIASQISEIQSPTRADIKSIVDLLNRSPSAESFWKLSRLIRLAQPTEVKPVIDQVAKLVMNNRATFVGAAFANAHLLRAAHQISYPEGYKWCRNFCFTDNIIWNAQLYNIISLPTYSNILSAQYNFLDSFSVEIQKYGAASIARHSKTPGNLLRRVLATISSKPSGDVELLQLSDISNQSSDSKVYRLRGLVYLATFLSTNPISIAEYKNALIPILLRTPENEADKSLCIATQDLLSKLMISNPTSFHNMKIFDCAIVQDNADNLTSSFLEGIIQSFGYFAFKKFIIPKKIFIWLDNIKKGGFENIQTIAPYTKYLESSVQLQIHQAMIELCEKNLFNSKLFNTTAIILMGSHPTVSPYIGQFIECAKRSVCSRSILSKLKPILEPKVQPILHPKREEMKAKELEKSDAFVQFNPTVDCTGQFKTVSISCDMSREILFMQKIEQKTTPLFSIHKPVNKVENIKPTSDVVNKVTDKSKETKEPPNKIINSNFNNNNNNKEENSSDVEIELNFDDPDSDDAE